MENNYIHTWNHGMYLLIHDLTENVVYRWMSDLYPAENYAI